MQAKRIMTRNTAMKLQPNLQGHRVIAVLYMSIALFMLTFLTAALLPSLAAGVAQAGELKIVVLGFRSDVGQAFIAISDNEATYESDDPSQEKDVQPFYAQVITTPRNGIAEVSLPNLRPGDYAVRVFHDANKDMKLDTNLLGIPREAVGISNNAIGSFGPKGFDKASIKIGENETKETRIDLREF